MAAERSSSPTRSGSYCANAHSTRTRSDGVRHDTGHKLGFLKATAYFALRQPDLAGPFLEYLKTLS